MYMNSAKEAWPVLIYSQWKQYGNDHSSGWVWKPWGKWGNKHSPQWQHGGSKRVLVVHTGPGETNEMAFSWKGRPRTVEGSGVKTQYKNGATVLQFSTSPERRVVEMGDDLTVYILGKQFTSYPHRAALTSI